MSCKQKSFEFKSSDLKVTVGLRTSLGSEQGTTVDDLRAATSEVAAIVKQLLSDTVRTSLG